VVTSGISVPAITQADNSSENRVQSQARKAFVARSEGRYEDAVALYLEAFEIEPVPSLLYNIAYIYDRDIGDLELAKRFYQRCIATEGVESAVVRRANKRLKQVRKRMEEKAIEADANSIRTVDPVDTSNSRRTVKESALPIITPRSNGPWWLMGIGAALVVSGGVTGGIAAYNAKQFELATILSEKKDIRDLTQKQALAADVFIGAGTLSILAGLTWYFIADDGHAAVPSVQVNPSYMGISWSSAF